MKSLVIILSFFTLLISTTSMSQDFEVSPVIMDFNGEPGTIVTRKLMIINHGSQKQAFEFKLSDYEVKPDGTKARLEAGTSNRSCADWLTLNPTIVELNPNERVSIDVMMTVPQGEYSSRWAMIYVQASREQEMRGADKAMSTGILITPRIVVTVTQSPKSNKNFRGVIENLVEITTPEDEMRKFNVDITNVGDKIIKANISMVLANIKTATETKYKGVKEKIFPGARRTVTLSLPKDVAPGKYALAAILDYGNQTALEGTQLIIEY